MNKVVCGFDCDGVLSIPSLGQSRIMPIDGDVIITGRSFEEKKETVEYLYSHNIFNTVYFNPIKFDEKSRESSGQHKADTINQLKSDGTNINTFWEDDEIQASIIQKDCPWLNVIMVGHDLIEKGNVRRDSDGNELL